MELDRKSIVVGISGGVDSAAAALALSSQGWRVIGVHLMMGTELCGIDQKRLQSLHDHGLKIHFVDCCSRFQSDVIEPFLMDYARCRTPNPCVICNERVKVRALMEQANAFGCYFVSTGHYARTVLTPDGPALARAHSTKDQSYMLYRLPADWIPRLVFPLAELEKDQVRRYAAEALGDPDLSGGSSQDICFLKHTSLKNFLTEKLLAGAMRSGPMVCEGTIVGTHEGLPLYTIGQRKGLGLSGGPWFVRSKEPSTNELRLDHLEEYRCARILITDCHWQRPTITGAEYLVQQRYRSKPVPGILSHCENGSAVIELKVPAGMPAPGQSAVLYDNDILVGGGIIIEDQEMMS